MAGPDHNFTQNFTAMPVADAPLVLFEQIATAKIGDKPVTVCRSAVGFGLWVNVGETRVEIPVSAIITDAIALAETLDADQ